MLTSRNANYIRITWQIFQHRCSKRNGSHVSPMEGENDRIACPHFQKLELASRSKNDTKND